MDQLGGKRSGRICCLTSKVNGERKPNAHMAKSKNYIIINSNNEILLVKSHKWIEKKWTVPGGHIELGETAHDAIIREVKEETGLEVKINIPIVETPIMLIATQIPLPKKNNKTVIKKIVNKISGIRFI